MDKLNSLLSHEESDKRTAQRTGMSRHSRFGTTISIMNVRTAICQSLVSTYGPYRKQGADRYILHKQKAVASSAAGVIDSLKRRRALHPSRKRQRDELGSGTDLTVEAMTVLQEYVTECLAVFDGESSAQAAQCHPCISQCLSDSFSDFFSSILKDIRLTRAKIRETDNLRALYLCRFFMEYLLAQRSKPSNVAIRAERIKAKAARKKGEARNKAALETTAAAEQPITLDDLLAEKQLNKDLENGQSNAPEGPEGSQREEMQKEPEEQQEPEGQKPEEQEEEPIDDFDFGYVAEMFEEDALRWMTSRLNQAQEAGVCCEQTVPACSF